MNRRRMMMMNQGGGYPRNGLVAEYLFEDNFNDTSGNGNDASSTDYIGFVTGKVGKCVSCDRTSNVTSRITTPSVSTMGCKTFSVCFKRGSGAYTSDKFMVSCYAYNIYFSISDTEIWFLGGAPSVNLVFSGGVPTSDSDWHHVAFVWQSGTLTSCVVDVYLDGVKLTLSSGTYTSETAINNVFSQLGTNYTGSLNTGYYDQYRIYNRVLAESEILKLYNNGTGV